MENLDNPDFVVIDEAKRKPENVRIVKGWDVRKWGNKRGSATAFLNAYGAELVTFALMSLSQWPLPITIQEVLQ